MSMEVRRSALVRRAVRSWEAKALRCRAHLKTFSWPDRTAQHAVRLAGSMLKGANLITM